VWQRNLFAQNLLERVRLLPGVQTAAIGVGGLPFGGPRSTFTIEGRPQADAQRVTVGLISADYLQTLGIPLRRGRALTEAEVARGDSVALINQAALRFWSTGEDPIGRRMTLDLLRKPGAPNVLLRTGTSPDLTILQIRLVGTQIFDMASLDTAAVLAVVAVLGAVALLVLCARPTRGKARPDRRAATRVEPFVCVFASWW
jgi:hypothetical protein